MSFQNCTHVTPSCPVAATTYGYRPNIVGNSLFLAIFAVVTIAQIILGTWKRLPAFGFAVSLGCLGETIGYIGRLIMHSNPWSSVGFKIQIVCLILSPSFLAAGIYLTLKHLVRVFGPEKSRLRPKLYTWIFISCDAFSILLQAAGGGLAAAETTSLVNIGDDVMIAGICFQVVTMFVCMLLAVDFARNLLRSQGPGKTAAAEAGIGSSGSGSEGGVVEDEKAFETTYLNYSAQRGFRFYVACSSFAFVLIFIRCVYRIPEMAGGWGNPLMQDETEFLVLDGAMIASASILLTVAHPGIFFPAIRSKI